MSIELFPSLKYTLAIGVVIAVALVGYEIVTHSAPATRAMAQQSSENFPDGEPSATLRQRVIFNIASSISMNRTLGNLEASIKQAGGEVTWEPTDDKTFIMSVERHDTFTKQTNTYEIEFIKLDDTEVPEIYQRETSAHWVTPNRMMVNGEIVDYRAALLFVYTN